MEDEKIESPTPPLYGESTGVNMTRRVLWKLDIRCVRTMKTFQIGLLLQLQGLELSTCRILPTLALLFLCSFIDRTNVGNAKILGLQKSIHITDHQYAIGLCVFYATYIARYVDISS
jgi:hypothetical protein